LTCPVEGLKNRLGDHIPSGILIGDHAFRFYDRISYFSCCHRTRGVAQHIVDEPPAFAPPEPIMPSIRLSRAYGIMLFPWIKQPPCYIDMSKIGTLQAQLLFNSGPAWQVQPLSFVRLKQPVAHPSRPGGFL